MGITILYNSMCNSELHNGKIIVYHHTALMKLCTQNLCLPFTKAQKYAVVIGNSCHNYCAIIQWTLGRSEAVVNLRKHSKRTVEKKCINLGKNISEILWFF